MPLGVHDMGDPKRGSRTAIDIVVTYGKPKRDAATAALWLCEQMRVDPVSLGWKAGRHHSRGRGFRRWRRHSGQCRQGLRPPLRGPTALLPPHGQMVRMDRRVLAEGGDRTGVPVLPRALARVHRRLPAEGAEAVRNISFAGGVEKFARSDRQMVATSETWDRDPFLLGTPAGTVDLRTGELREPDPRDGITKITAVAPAETADCPRWRRFLVETFGDKEPELIRFIQQWSGYCLTGDIREHALAFGFGNGKNGKSVWLTTITSIMRDYAVTAPMEAFTASKFDRHPTELAMLRGARLVTASETEKDRRWAESRIKQITGGDRISARFMRQDFSSSAAIQVDYHRQPQAAAAKRGRSHPPAVQSHSFHAHAGPGQDRPAAGRKTQIGMARHPALDDRGLPRLAGEWTQRPESVIRATESYFADQDLLAQWLDESVRYRAGEPAQVRGDGRSVRVMDRVCQTGGRGTGKPQDIHHGTEQAGVRAFREGHDNIRSFRGLRLKPS